MTKKDIVTEGTDRRLHRYFDRDLPADEREALEREIAKDDVLARKLTALGDVRTLVRGAAEKSTITEADSASMWAAIERGAGLDAGVADASASDASASDAKPARPALRLVTGAGEASAATESASGQAAAKLVPGNGAGSKQIAEDPATRRRRTFGVVIGVLALAAAAVLAFVQPGDPPAEDPVAQIDEPVVESVDPPDSMRTEVLAVDFGTNVGTIFAVEGTAGQRYAVVWLDDAVKIDEGAASPEEETPN